MSKMSKLKYVLSYDFETNDRTADRVPVDLGAVLLDKNTYKTVAEFQLYIKLEPGEKMNPEAEAVHGLSMRYLEQVGVSRETARIKFLQWLDHYGVEAPWREDMVETHRGQIMALGQNVARFDEPIMDWFLGDPMNEVFTYNPYDTLPLFRMVNDVNIYAFGYGAHPFKNLETGYPSVRLGDVAAAHGLEFTDAHRAIADARMVAKLYPLLIKNLADDFKAAEKWNRLENHRNGKLSGPGVYCPYCGARVSKKGDNTGTCVACGETWGIYRWDGETWDDGLEWNRQKRL